MDLAQGPCVYDPELFYDPEFPEEITDFDQDRDEEYRLVMARWQREKHEREVKAQLVCLTLCPLPRRALCQQLSVDEEHGVWAGLRPEDRAAAREGRPARTRKIRSVVGTTRAQMARELLRGLSVAEIAEMHGTTRTTVLSQLSEQVMVLSAPSVNMQVA